MDYYNFPIVLSLRINCGGGGLRSALPQSWFIDKTVISLVGYSHLDTLKKLCWIVSAKDTFFYRCY